jgi:Fic family protein
MQITSKVFTIPKSRMVRHLTYNASQIGEDLKRRFPVATNIKTALKQTDELKEVLRKYNGNTSKYFEKFNLKYIVESGRIEGNPFLEKEAAFIFANKNEPGGFVQTVSHPDSQIIVRTSLKDHIEIINHINALNYMLDKPFDCSHTYIKEIHRRVWHGLNDEAGIEEQPGTYRQYSLFMPGSTLTPSEPKQIEADIDWLTNYFLSNKEKLHPVVLAANVHEQFIRIHPFRDGNGRTSRLIMNGILQHFEYPMAIIPGDKKAKRAFIEELRGADRKHAQYDDGVPRFKDDGIQIYLSNKIRETIFWYLDNLSKK